MEHNGSNIKKKKSHIAFIDIFKPTPNQLIYHYCNSDSFHAICQNKTIRLSDLNLMNDGLEIKWGYSIWIELANQLITEFGHDFIDEIDKVIHGFGLHSLMISSSFSRKPDIPNQWQAYAEDGKGFCIGFKAKELFQLPVYPVKIIYNKREQIRKIKNIVKYIHENTKDFGNDFFELCFQLTVELASLKNSSLEEEEEIRMIHLLTFFRTKKSLKLIDAGGYTMGQKTAGQKILYGFRYGCPIAYQDYDFTINKNIHPIKQVILGPKNNCIPLGISVYLETIGIENVHILKSKASYI
jgi:hypothetical protein